ncbi:MAG: TlpA family protein disulfide reductase [Armatimonadota bacterium]|jgi:peroxiredoxin
MTRTLAWVAMVSGIAILMLTAGCGEQPAMRDTVQVPEGDLARQDDEGPEIEETEPGKEAPDFTVPLVGGGEVSLADYAGKILVLDFWATWCGACVAEFPHYQELYDGWDHDEVAYLGLSADGDMNTVEAFMRGRPDLTLPMALASDELLEAYLPTRTLPSSRVIDADGIVRYEFRGPGAEKVEAAVRRLLAESEE